MSEYKTMKGPENRTQVVYDYFRKEINQLKKDIEELKKLFDERDKKETNLLKES